MKYPNEEREGDRNNTHQRIKNVENENMYTHTYVHVHIRQVESVIKKERETKNENTIKKKLRKERQTRRSCKTEQESITLNTGCNHQNITASPR